MPPPLDELVPRCDAPPRCALEARVVACMIICRDHVRIELAVPAFPPSTPGQFLQLLCRDPGGDPGARSTGNGPAGAIGPDTRVHEWPANEFPKVVDPDFLDTQPYLRRPFSIADRWTAQDGSARLAVISRTIGPGTRWLAQLRPGDRLDVTGPLGRGFRIPSQDAPLLLVGGGVGIPPLLYLARRLHELGRRNATAIFGATTRAVLPLALAAEPPGDGAPARCIELPGAAPYPAMLTTDDGSLGLKGRVTEALLRWHERQPRGALSRPVVFACGPEAMLRAVAELTRRLEYDCQLCIERNMGCGLGTCLSCVVRARTGAHPSGWRWALACTDGPVFARDDLLDYGGCGGP
ncbi:MAG: hypothetical protein AB1716_06360 [Planctomycetota bacterium]